MLDAPTIVRAESARVLALSDDTALARAVPHLGRWTVRDLVAHLGAIHRWATDIVRTASWDGSMARACDLDGEELRRWFAEGAEALATALATTPPDAPCPNFSPGSPAVAAFWSRRQVHETTMHRWDAEHAVGRETPIAHDVALDGIDEALRTFTRSRGKQDLAAPLALRSGGRTWTLVPSTTKPGRVDLAGDGATDATAVVVEAEPEALLLALWRRVPLGDDARITGDADIARRFLAGPVTP